MRLQFASVRLVAALISLGHVSLGTLSCSSAGEGASAPTAIAVPDPATAPPIEVTKSDTRLTFRYFPKSGGPKSTSNLDSVPAEARASVLVIPEGVEVPAGLAYVADLRTPGPDGKYPYTVMTQAQLDAQLAATQVAAAPRSGIAAGGSSAGPSPSVAGSPTARAPQGDREVIMYSTSWCGVCTQARRWFKNKGIVYVDRDIEADPAAEADLLRRATSVGVDRARLTGVPIIWVNGQLLPGFDPAKIEAALRS